MFKKKEDQDKILQDAVYGTGGIPLPEVGAVTVGKEKRKGKRSFFAELFHPKKVKPQKPKPAKPNLFQKIFSSAKFKRKKGIDGF